MEQFSGKYLLFDFGGTLDYYPGWVTGVIPPDLYGEAILDFLNRVGRKGNWTAAQVQKATETATHLAPRRGPDNWLHNFKAYRVFMEETYRLIGICEPLPVAELEAAISWLIHYTNKARSPFVPEPVRQSLREWRSAGYVLALVSNNIGYGSDRLAIDGVIDLFTLTIDSARVNAAKPAPAIYQIALERLGAQPEECLFAGDDWTNDLQTPVRLGMWAAWISQGRELPASELPVRGFCVESGSGHRQTPEEAWTRRSSRLKFQAAVAGIMAPKKKFK